MLTWAVVYLYSRKEVHWMPSFSLFMAMICDVLIFVSIAGALHA